MGIGVLILAVDKREVEGVSNLELAHWSAFLASQVTLDVRYPTTDSHDTA
jgi:hypothetical protein